MVKAIFRRMALATMFVAGIMIAIGAVIVLWLWTLSLWDLWVAIEVVGFGSLKTFCIFEAIALGVILAVTSIDKAQE